MSERITKPVVTDRWVFRIVIRRGTEERFEVAGTVSQGDAWRQARERFGGQCSLHVLERPPLPWAKAAAPSSRDLTE